MLLFLEFNQFLQLLDLGGLAVLAWIMSRWASRKDKQAERQHEITVELVREVTKALTDKNHSDDDMADAVRELKSVIDRKFELKERRNEAT